MKDNVEYQLFIGCNDPDSKNELVQAHELEKMLLSFFERKKINFSMFSCQGGYIGNNGIFIDENSVCINIIGTAASDITSLANSLRMFMNQEHVLIMKHSVRTKFY